MTDREIILRDLLTGRSTADAIKEHTGLPDSVISAILADEEIAGTTESRPLQSLTVWQLTARGQEIAIQLPKAPALF